MKFSNFLFAAAFAATPISGAKAQQIVHKFINPSFGGTAFNSSHLLGLAEIQQQHHAPTASREEVETGDQRTERFIQQLESRLLSELSQNLVGDITGIDVGVAPRSVTVGDQIVTYERTLTELIVTVTSTFDPLIFTELRVPSDLLASDQ